MDSQRYRVILSGELLPGYSEDAAVAALAEVFQTPASALRGLFDGVEHPVDQALSAERALELQSRLDRIGVRCRIERMSEQNIQLQLRDAPRGAPVQTATTIATDTTNPGLMHCPACGHRQLVSNRCEACGVVFAEYNASGAPPRPAVPSASPATPPPAATPPRQPHPPASEEWRDAWVDADENYEPDERTYLALFFGEQPEAYLSHCERQLAGARTHFTLSWNWGAVVSPFMWALYRKMLGWSAVIFVTEIFLPLLLIILGSYEITSYKLVYVGYAGLLANRIFWPLLANYLYCRHARVTLQRLHMLSPNYAAEIDIATAGGTSAGSVLVGLTMAAVMAMFLWSVVDSVHHSSQQTLQPRLLEMESGDEMSGGGDGRVDDVLGLDSANLQPENKWVSTRKRLRTLGQHINTWITKHQGADASQLSLFRLREDASLPIDDLVDGWGSELQYIPDTEGYRLISAGPDHLFGTADDIQYRRVLTR